jgi:hypothetical protein
MFAVFTAEAPAAVLFLADSFETIIIIIHVRDGVK